MTKQSYNVDLLSAKEHTHHIKFTLTIIEELKHLREVKNEIELL